MAQRTLDGFILEQAVVSCPECQQPFTTEMLVESRKVSSSDVIEADLHRVFNDAEIRAALLSCCPSCKYCAWTSAFKPFALKPELLRSESKIEPSKKYALAVKWARQKKVHSLDIAFIALNGLWCTREAAEPENLWLELAIFEHEKGIAASPSCPADDGMTHLIMGELYRQHRDFDKAEREYKLAENDKTVSKEILQHLSMMASRRLSGVIALPLRLARLYFEIEDGPQETPLLNFEPEKTEAGETPAPTSVNEPSVTSTSESTAAAIVADTETKIVDATTAAQTPAAQVIETSPAAISDAASGPTSAPLLAAISSLFSGKGSFLDAYADLDPDTQVEAVKAPEQTEQASQAPAQAAAEAPAIRSISLAEELTKTAADLVPAARAAETVAKAAPARISPVTRASEQASAFVPQAAPVKQAAKVTAKVTATEAATETAKEKPKPAVDPATAARRARAQAQAEEATKLGQEAEKAKQAEAARLAQEAEAARIAQEAEAARLAQEAEATRIHQEAEAAKEREFANLAKEIEAAKLAQEAEIAKKTQEAQAALDAVKQAQASAKPSATRICSSCKRAAGKGRYCIACGKPVEAEAPKSAPELADHSAAATTANSAVHIPTPASAQFAAENPEAAEQPSTKVRSKKIHRTEDVIPPLAVAVDPSTVRKPEASKSAATASKVPAAPPAAAPKAPSTPAAAAPKQAASSAPPQAPYSPAQSGVFIPASTAPAAQPAAKPALAETEAIKVTRASVITSPPSSSVSLSVTVTAPDPSAAQAQVQEEAPKRKSRAKRAKPPREDHHFARNPVAINQNPNQYGWINDYGNSYQTVVHQQSIREERVETQQRPVEQTRPAEPTRAALAAEPSHGAAHNDAAASEAGAPLPGLAIDDQMQGGRDYSDAINRVESYLSFSRRVYSARNWSKL